MSNVRFVKPMKKVVNVEYCKHFPSGYVYCSNYKDCERCELGDRIRRDKAMKSASVIFSFSDARRQTEKANGDMWWHFPIILSPEAMLRLDIECNMFYQIAVADFGPGCFLKNPAGEIDCHLFANSCKRFTISRKEAYGIPTDAAVRKYDDLFFMGLEKAVKIAFAKKEGVWCL